MWGGVNNVPLRVLTSVFTLILSRTYAFFNPLHRPLQKQRNHQIVFVCLFVCVRVCVFVYFCQGAAFGYSDLLHLSFFYILIALLSVLALI